MDDTTLFADEAWYFADEKRAVAAGNVTYSSRATTESQPIAPRWTHETRLGVFHNAWGLANIQPQRQQVAPVGGFVAPQLTGQDTDVYFFGETVEKVGPKKYKIKNGGFTTCVQPSPRWNMNAGETRAEHRLVYASQERGLQRERRAAVLPPRPLLPHQGRRPGDRVSAADLRQEQPQGAAVQQRVFLGDQSQPGRDDQARLVLEGRPGL